MGNRIVPKPEFYAGSQESLRAKAGDRVCFNHQQSELDVRSKATLKRVAKWLVENPERGLVLEGHAKQRATREYSVGISVDRLHLVAGFLKKSGVSQKKLRLRPYGKERANVLCKGDFTAVYLIPVRNNGQGFP